MARLEKGDKVRIKREFTKDYGHLDGTEGVVMARGPQGIKVKLRGDLPGWVQEAHLEKRK